MKENIRDFVMKIARGKGIFVDDDTDLYTEGVLDSFEILELLVFLQDTLNVTYENGDLDAEKFKSINKITEFAQNKKV